MPGWHAATSEAEAEGRVRVVGIAQEQHGDRTALFLQWHRIDWPVLLDSFNLLGVEAVPITLFVDEFGVIRARNPEPADLRSFLEAGFDPPAAVPPPAGTDGTLPRDVLADDPRTIDAFLAEAEASPNHPFTTPAWRFRLGVLHRKRHDLPAIRRPDDFAAAVSHWREALARNPNQYIWRRRIQQYGPRLDKPYPFYDWVPEARKEILARGDEPLPLAVEPTGAEIASPAQGPDPTAVGPSPAHPDPDGRLARDDGRLLTVAATAVPSTDPARPGWRIHLTFTPNPSLDAHWNNESGPALLLADPPSSPWAVTPAAAELAPPPDEPPSPVSGEPRGLEIELVAPNTGEPTIGGMPAEFSASLFFHACEGADGACRFVRRDFKVPLARFSPR